MSAKVTIYPKFSKNIPDGFVVDTTSRASSRWEKSLSPFYLGPIRLYGNYISQNMENAWQFAKVYRPYDNKDIPNSEYWKWAIKGWASKFAHRYPMGKGAAPLYSWWDGEKLDYIGARKKIYGPLYTQNVQNTEGYRTLEDIYYNEGQIVLLDFDGYDHDKLNMNLTDVLHDTRRKMGHAFFLKALLTNDSVLDYIG